MPVWENVHVLILSFGVANSPRFKSSPGWYSRFVVRLGKNHYRLFWKKYRWPFVQEPSFLNNRFVVSMQDYNWLSLLHSLISQKTLLKIVPRCRLNLWDVMPAHNKALIPGNTPSKCIEDLNAFLIKTEIASASNCASILILTFIFLSLEDLLRHHLACYSSKKDHHHDFDTRK